MKRRLMLALAPLWVAACSTAPVPEATVVSAPEAPSGGPQQMEFKLASGRYDCDAGQTVVVQRHADDGNRIEVRWKGRSAALERNPSASGLPRYESGASPLVWIDLPWKSFLLDQQSGKPLASDCVAS
ncbi:hypothetical protein G3580_01620 [Nitrogeniibacter mangrovi]|uniref:C-type lysozyme inhibitor domain-containing protein n=1 Tax=Nitrogeniibacter mangrovi TaxID=2016596 RepID=A0A6C1B0T1_9RHOO|nr:MliC family protein [Nitrogeniibacter mangrovi]QID16438.1 hypothetical protein G3580_01620 [Nitrogeniibacter mangrovi]